MKNFYFSVGTKEVNFWKSKFIVAMNKFIFFSGLEAWIYFQVKDKTQLSPLLQDITPCLQEKKKEKKKKIMSLILHYALWEIFQKNLEQFLAEFDLIWPGSWGENHGVFRQQSLKCSLEQIFAAFGRWSSRKCNIYFCLGEENSLSNQHAWKLETSWTPWLLKVELPKIPESARKTKQCLSLLCLCFY